MARINLPGGAYIKFKNPLKRSKERNNDPDLSEGSKADLNKKEAKNIDSQREDKKLHRVQSGRTQKRRVDPKAEIKNKFKKLMRNLENFNDFLEEMKENGVIVDENAQKWVKNEINDFKDAEESINRIKEGDIEKWNIGVEKDLALTYEKIVEFEKQILEESISDMSLSLYGELDKYEEYINNLKKNYIYGRDHIKDYEFNENIGEMRSFLKEEREKTADNLKKLKKIYERSNDSNELEIATFILSDALKNEKELIKENKMNFSPEFNEKQKANYFTQMEEDRRNYRNNNHKSAAG